MENIKQWVDKICEVLDDKKALDIETIEIGKLTIIADYFVIASGRSTLQVKALCDELENAMDEAGMPVFRKDGYESGRWIVMDYGSVIVHLFHTEERQFYDLERLWTDGENRSRYHQQEE